LPGVAPSILKYKRTLVEVLVALFALRLFGLVSSLFFRMIIDEFLVHRGQTTLDVLVNGLAVITLFEGGATSPEAQSARGEKANHQINSFTPHG
jgi:ABC-type bacteriocin/lantibiotic exporter with double-glycine peptidase domain